MMGSDWYAADFDWHVDDRVLHVKDAFREGTIRQVEDNGLSVMVQWDDLPEDELDFQWANKLVSVQS